ncbi:C39 family peptidase [Pseudomonas sp. LP_7_YM]|uniref:C39 family peptidase n=1 Tax=Pseudomonas sp. LP_7_YM TaxID=2485137 RepID=UPI0010EC6F1D|nr:C39 family peptidase [Pseudomonas sp. LP_7_YM]TDV61782.1 hypothetical protein EC915_1085 [Pseudomonas sp. LP_7_YM]
MTGRAVLTSLMIVWSTLVSQAAQADAGPRLMSIKQIPLQGIQRQTLDYSCGAAALAILLRQYFEDPVQERQVLADMVFRLPPEEAADRVYTGFSMLDLKRAAHHLGYGAQGVMLPADAVNALKGPVIILLRNAELNHFVILKGVSQGRAFLADPSRGHLRMPLFELLEQWNGETLIVERAGFGLPDAHGLNLPESHNVAPERETARSLQQTWINR